jgi:hypothetical protein
MMIVDTLTGGLRSLRCKKRIPYGIPSFETFMEVKDGP